MDYGEEYKEKLANLRGWNLFKEANKMRKRLLAFSKFGDVDEAYRCIKENIELKNAIESKNRQIGIARSLIMDELEKRGIDTGGKYLTMLTALKILLGIEQFRDNNHK
nr:hypothetical protein [Prevotella sp.]